MKGKGASKDRVWVVGQILEGQFVTRGIFGTEAQAENVIGLWSTQRAGRGAWFSTPVPFGLLFAAKEFPWVADTK